MPWTVEELVDLLNHFPKEAQVVVTYEHDEWGETDIDILGLTQNKETGQVGILTTPL